MKKLSAFLFILILTIPAYARSTRRAQLRTVPPASLSVTRVPNARPLVLKALAQARAADKQDVRASKKDVGTTAIITNRSARALVIPAAGSVPGAFGTFYRSDVTFANWNDTNQLLGIVWVPNGNPAGFELFTLTLAPTSIATVEDFVGETLQLEGLGSIVVLPFLEPGEIDPDAAIDIFSRIWTPQPNATGTVSQPFPAVEPAYMTNEEDGIILGLRQDAQYRTNYGILNLSEDDLTFELSVLPEDSVAVTQTFTVPSLGMIQTGIPAGAHGQLSLGFSLTSVPTTEFTWIAYGTSSDNTTGDGWVSIVANPWDDAQLDEEEDQ